MAQEQFAGPEHYTDFDPEKFIQDMKIMAQQENQEGEESTDQDPAVDQPEQ